MAQQGRDTRLRDFLNGKILIHRKIRRASLLNDNRKLQFLDDREMSFENFRLNNITCFFRYQYSRLSEKNNCDRCRSG